MNNALNYISSKLKQAELKHEIHQFDSGATMIDIWKGDSFYVVQIEGNSIGLSLVTEQTGFEATPDQSYNSLEEFVGDFENIFGSVA